MTVIGRSYSQRLNLQEPSDGGRIFDEDLRHGWAPAEALLEGTV